MRCANCGMPLSPARTHCPKCGAARDANKVSNEAQVPANNNTFRQTGFEARQTQRSREQQASPLAYKAQTAPATQHPGHQYTPLPDTPIPPLEASQPSDKTNQTLVSPFDGIQQTNWDGVPLTDHDEAGQPAELPQRLPWALHIQQPEKTRLTIAGSCVLLGGLVLLVVYFMARGLSGSAGVSSSTQGTQRTTMLSSAPSATALPTATTIAITMPGISPTAIYPGQKYIDGAQMAAAVDTHSAQATQLATTFKTNQLIYVTFAVHSGARSGAACLTWYLNHNVIANYGLDVAPTTNAYSYARLDSPGAAYVEIFWASTKACTDKVLAQHVDFSVSA